MDLKDTNIEGSFSNSLLTKYLENVISNRPLDDVINKLAIRFNLFTEDGNTQIIEAIDRSRIDYIILATKLSTMIEIFNMIKQDDNLVLIDDLEKEIERFEKEISKSIQQTKIELVNK